MIEKFKNLTIVVKVVIFIDLLVILTQTIVSVLFFTPWRDSVLPFVENNIGSYDKSIVFGLIFSVTIMSLVVRGLLNKKHWAVLMQIFLMIPLFFAFPLGTTFFVVVVYKFVKLERS